MGLDVNLYAEGEFSADDVAKAEDYLKYRTWLPDREYNEGRALGVAEMDEHSNRVEMFTLSRYYGPGYERGDWPQIYGAIRLMQAAFPRCTVFYGTDSTDSGLECTDEFLAEMWAHFLGPSGDSYRRRP